MAEKELVTPTLDSGLILPGVTRQSLLDLAREWVQSLPVSPHSVAGSGTDLQDEFKVSERSITMAEISKALKEERVRAGCGARRAGRGRGDCSCTRCSVRGRRAS